MIKYVSNSYEFKDYFYENINILGDESMDYAIGVDIGGTKVAIAVINEQGKVIEESVIPTNVSITSEKMMDTIIEEIQTVIKKSQVNELDIIGLGIGAPGPLDSRNGIILCPPNLTGWIDVPIQAYFAKTFDWPIKLENDANAAALAEKWLGAARKNNHFAYMTISTGIGAGIVVEGKLLRGLKGNAGDIGHTVIDPSFGECTCGQKGCLEAVASGTAIAKHGSKIVGKNLSTKEVFALYHEGHEQIVEMIDHVLMILGMACVNLINTFDLEKIVIGGGVSKVGDLLFHTIQKYVQTYALNPIGRQAEIVPAKLNQNAGVIGAAALCFNLE